MPLPHGAVLVRLLSVGSAHLSGRYATEKHKQNTTALSRWDRERSIDRPARALLINRELTSATVE
jgi:hypothetical protein